MKSHIAGIGIALLFLSVFTAVSGYTNHNTYLESVDAGEFARDFSRYCTTRMKKQHMAFRYSVPTVKYGCVCVGVKLERQYSSETQNHSDELKKAFKAYLVYLRETEMKRSVQNLAWTIETPENLKRAVKSSFHICDDYDLEGNKRLDMAFYPDYLKNVEDKYYVLARPR